MLVFRKAWLALPAVPHSVSKGLLWALHVSCLLLALHYEVINPSIKSGAQGEQLVSFDGCKKRSGSAKDSPKQFVS